jgi:hypothetical protein
MWKVGMKAVCINDDWRPIYYSFSLPKRGQVLEVIGLGTRMERPGLGDIALQFAEFQGQYWSAHFRPAVEPSIEVFEQLLKKLPKPEPLDA